jgi:hypothetical protein
METLIKCGLAVLLLLCLLDMPYGYYQLVRFFGMAGFGILAYLARKRGEESYFFLWLTSAVLINPFFKVALGRALWNIIDVIWAALLLISLWTQKNGTRSTDYNDPQD